MESNNTYRNFMEIASNRFSCRDFLPAAIAKDVMIDVIEAARIAPSACNKQPWKFIIVDSPKGREAIISCYERDWIKSAPAFILAVGIHSEAWHRNYDQKDSTDIDLAIAIQQICLAATASGLGTCWVCNFDAPKCSTLFQLSDDCEPIAIIPIGYPADNKNTEKKRKPISEILEWANI